MKIQNGKRNSTRSSNFSVVSASRETHLACDGILRRGQRRRRSRDAVMDAPGRGRGGSGCATPNLNWKSQDGVRGFSITGGKAPVAAGRVVQWVKGNDVVEVSARKLSAGLWRLVGPGGGSRAGARQQWPPLDWLKVELHSSLQIPASAMEGATMWDNMYSKLTSEVRNFCSLWKPNQNQLVATASVASALHVQLVHAQKRVEELETDCRLYKKKLEHFLKKLNEERASSKRRKLQKVRALIDDLKDQLGRERRNCKYSKTVNSELLKNLNDAKLLDTKLQQKYEKERKIRVFLEDTCNRLAKQIEADKSEIQARTDHCLRIQEKVEKERKVLQMAEVWREERVQMKLVDAKLMLENKYCQLNNLIADLESFLRSRSIALDKKSEARMIRQIIESVNVQDANEFSYMLQKSDGVYESIEDLKGNEAGDERINHCLGLSSASHASEVRIGSPEINGVIRNTSAKDQFSSYSLCEREHDGNGDSIKLISSGRKEREPYVNHQSMNSQTSEISSVSVKQTMKTGTSCFKPRRSLSTDDNGCNAIPANTPTSDITTTSRGKASGGKAAQQRSDFKVKRSPPGTKNPHIARAMKGCIEWPHGIQRSGLKTKLLEARLASQRTQLRSILKRRI